MVNKQIYFLWATVRPDMFLETYKIWINNQIVNTEIITMVAVATKEQKDKIDSFNLNRCFVTLVDKQVGYNYAITQLTKILNVNDNDIIITVTDDFQAPLGWDRFILEKYENFDGALFLDDGYQDVNVKKGELCITLGCLTFSALKKVNRFVFHPAYNHYFSDNECYHNFEEMGILLDTRDVDNMKFSHKKGTREKDEYDKRYMTWWKEDKDTYYNRCKLSLKERLE